MPITDYNSLLEQLGYPPVKKEPPMAEEMKPKKHDILKLPADLRCPLTGRRTGAGNFLVTGISGAAVIVKDYASRDFHLPIPKDGYEVVDRRKTYNTAEAYVEGQPLWIVWNHRIATGCFIQAVDDTVIYFCAESGGAHEEAHQRYVFSCPKEAAKFARLVQDHLQYHGAPYQNLYKFAEKYQPPQEAPPQQAQEALPA